MKACVPILALVDGKKFKYLKKHGLLPAMDSGKQFLFKIYLDIDSELWIHRACSSTTGRQRKE